MKKILFTVLVGLFCLGFQNLNAQAYGSAIGLRAGTGFTATYKVFIGEKPALEIFGGIPRSGNGVYAGLLYEHHLPIGNVSNFTFYFGGGGQTFLGDAFALGASGAVGLDYGFEGIPLNLSVDWLPTIGLLNFGDRKGVNFGALSIRYILAQ